MLRTLIVGLLAVGLVGCEAAKKDTKDALKKVGETGAKVVEDAKAKLASLKDEFKKKFEGPLADLGKKLTELKDKAAKATGDEKTKLDEKLKGAEGLMTQAKDQFGKIGDVASDKWDDWKKTFEDLIEKLKKALE